MPSADLDIAIIGAGAAGLMAAIVAGRTARAAATDPPLRIAALDGAPQLGAKILVAGGGRCNVTHDVVTPDDYAGSNPRLIARVLRSFPVADTVAFFESLGVTLKTEDSGKLFPVTDRARTVLDALLRAATEAGVELRPGHRVAAVVRRDDLFTLDTTTGPVTARRVILATGGKSLPKTGSDGHGHQIARALGHTLTPTTPALVPLLLPKDHWLIALPGQSFDGVLTLSAPTGKVLHRQRGPILLTHFGLSGPAVMDMSRHWIAAHAANPGVVLSASLLPGLTFEQVEQHLLDAMTRRPLAAVATVLSAWMSQRLADALANASGVDPRRPMTRLTRDDRRALVHALTALPLPVTGDRGYLFAEATAGGVPLAEVDPATMQSRRCSGLYLCGELLDVDGRIGGYNFQWAWCTGRLAGLAAAAPADQGG